MQTVIPEGSLATVTEPCPLKWVRQATQHNHSPTHTINFANNCRHIANQTWEKYDLKPQISGGIMEPCDMERWAKWRSGEKANWWNSENTKYWIGWTVEWRDGKMAKWDWQHGRKFEWRNGKMVKWISGRLVVRFLLHGMDHGRPEHYTGLQRRNGKMVLWAEWWNGWWDWATLEW